MAFIYPDVLHMSLKSIRRDVATRILWAHNGNVVAGNQGSATIVFKGRVASLSLPTTQQGIFSPEAVPDQ